jgi:hypothetical protein
MEYSKHNKAILYNLHSKACAMADVLRNSIYGIMSAPKQVFLIRIGLLKANPEPRSCMYRNCIIY